MGTEPNAEHLRIMAGVGSDLLGEAASAWTRLTEFAADRVLRLGGWLVSVAVRGVALLLMFLIALQGWRSWQEHPDGNTRLLLLLAGLSALAIAWESKYRARRQVAGRSRGVAVQVVQAVQSTPMSARERQVVAWHEAGHALAAWYLPQLPPPGRIWLAHHMTTGTLGRVELDGPSVVNSLTPAPETYARIVFALAGRAAEKALFDGDTASGACDDVSSARGMAGWLTASRAVFSGRSFAYPEAVIQAAMDDADDLIAAHHRELGSLVSALLDRMTAPASGLGQTIEGDDLHALLTLHFGPVTGHGSSALS